MGIKVMESLPFEDVTRNLRQEKLRADLRQILDEKIRYCELTDYQYSMSCAVEKIRDEMRRVAYHYSRDHKLAVALNSEGLSECFKVHKKKQEDGTFKLYIEFSPEKFEEQLEKAKIAKEERDKRIEERRRQREAERQVEEGLTLDDVFPG